MANLGPKVSTSSLSVGDLAKRYWGSEFDAPDHGAYVFSGNRKFDSTDRGGRNGIYGVTGGLLIDQQSAQYPDMYGGVVLNESGEPVNQS